MSKQKILPVEPLIQCEAGRAKTMQRQSLYSPRTPKWPPSDEGELEAVVEEIRVKIEDGSGAGLDDDAKRKLHFDYDKAKEAIGACKAHNIRVVNQDLAKQDVLSKLNGNNCLIVMDWAMKFLPLRYREQMREFLEREVRAGT